MNHKLLTANYPPYWLIFLILLLIFVFVGITTYQLYLPGLHYDEAFEVVPAMQLLNGEAVDAFRDSTLTLFGIDFPLTTQDYIGALNTYGSLPFLWIGGITVGSLRSYAIFIGVITLFVVYGFTADLSGYKEAGLVAVTLLVVNPTFIFWTRQGIFVTAITVPIGVGAAWCWLKWWRSKQFKYAILGAFLFGLGIYAKLLFVWLIAALFGAFIISLLTLPLPYSFSNLQKLGKLFNLRQLSAIGGRQSAVKLSIKYLIGLLLAAIAGCWPLILYNLQTGGTFKNIGENANTSYYGVNNADVWQNLATRTEQLHTLLSSGHLWYLGEVYKNNLLPTLWVISFIASLWLLIKHKKVYCFIPFAVIGLVTLESIVTVSALWVTHFALIMVWPAIGLAVIGTYLFYYFKRYKPIQGFIFVLFLGLLLTEINSTWHYHQALSISGGLSDHSDATYDLVAWLDENTDGRSVIAMDWGLSASITYLTAGRITPIEVFGYEWANTNRFEQLIPTYLTPHDAIFLWRAPDEVIFDRSADFKALYTPLDLEETILEAFYERNGRPIVGATELVPMGEAENRP